jgi:hypothetical protein
METSAKQLTFSNYLNSHYILLDFDDVDLDWATNTKQKDKSLERQRKKILH